MEFYDEFPESRLAGLFAESPLFIFVNPTEYHGPHLPLANDYLISRGLAERLFQRLKKAGLAEQFIAAPLVNLGLDPTPGPGTITTTPRQFDSHLDQIAEKLPGLGVKRAIVMTFHGAPRHNHALQRFIKKLGAVGIQALNPMNTILKRLLEYRPGDYAEAIAPVKDASVREEISKNLGSDYHGGFFETSLTLALAPASVDPAHKHLPDCPAIEIPAWQRAAIQGMRSVGQPMAARELFFAAEALAWLKLDPFPGYTGKPRFANAKSGELFVARILDEYEAAVHAVFVDGMNPPEPVMGVTELIAGVVGV
ncbi:MAG: creatininase family protein [Spirochaetes bacterium]|nr:creatininase family protein [Spirochaetota bacterium]MBX3721452.1 creatininase family protein [Turneriella sp.]